MNKSIKLIFNYLLAPVLFIILTWSLYEKISRQPDLAERWLQIKQSWQVGWFWLVVALLFVNWGIEARKWQLLIAHLEKFSFSRSFKSVLAGCSITMLTPNRIGEYAGRIIFVKPENRLKAISLTILGSMSQLLVTLFFGSCGLVALHFYPSGDKFNSLPWLFNDVFLSVSIFFTIMMVLVYFKIHWIVVHLRRLQYLKKLVNYINVLDEFSGKQLLRIMFLSFSRYMVFILQYVLLLNILNIEVSMVLCFWLLTIFYLVMAIAPTIGFIELPVRAMISFELFSLYSNNTIGIEAAALGIWLINLVMPAIIGSLLIFGIKILKDR